MQIDYVAIGTAIVGGIVAIVGVNAWLKTNTPKILPWVALAKDAVETVNDITEALQPDATGKVELTPEEIAKINADAVNFQKQLAVLLGH